MAAGVASTLASDPQAQEKLLAEADDLARIAVLACARLVRDRLPIDQVASLLSHHDPLLSLAAERYLEAEDGPEARAWVQGRHHGEALLLGARMSFDPGHATYGEFDMHEEELRQLVLSEDGPVEVIALLSSGYWGGAGQIVILLDEDDSGLLSYCADPARCGYRNVSTEEIGELRAFLTERRFEDLGPLDHRVHDGVQFEYVRLNRDGGRRVFMNNPDGGSAYALVTNRIRSLAVDHPLEIGYHIQSLLPGMQLLFSGEGEVALSVCGGDGGPLVLLQGEGGDRSWFELAENGAGAPAKAPPACGESDRAVPELLSDRSGFQPIRNAWQLGDSRYSVLLGGWRDRGLFHWNGQRKPTLLVDGWFGGAIATPGGRWVVASRTEEGQNWAVPNPIVRVEVASGEESFLDVPPGDNLNPIAYLEGRERMLVERLADSDSDAHAAAEPQPGPQYFLVDASTGHVQPIDGDFRPYQERIDRPFQSTAVADEVWVALPDSEGTAVGRYDTDHFTFVPVASYPTVSFGSSDLWVDELAGKALATYRGDLLLLPLGEATVD